MARGASVATAAGSPRKKKHSPKKARFHFNIKNFLNLKRPDHTESSTLLRDGVSPIHTGKRTTRSTSEPMIHINRMSACDGDEEEEKRDSEQPRRDSASAGQEEVQEEAQDAIIPQLRLYASEGEQDDCAVVMAEERTQQLRSELQSVNARVYLDSVEVHQDARYDIDSEEDDGSMVTGGSLRKLQCVSKSVDVGHQPEPPSESQDERAQDTYGYAIKIDGQDEERSGTRQPQAPGEVVDDVLLPLDSLVRTDEQGPNAISSIDCTRCFPHTFPADGYDKLPGFSGASETVRNDVAGLRCACPADSASDVGNSSKSEEMHRGIFMFALPLSRIEEEEESEGDSELRGDMLSVSVRLSNDLEGVIPATTTHRIRVGVLPGSPIHTSARLMNMFEMDDETSDEETLAESFSDHITTSSDEQNSSSATGSTMSTTDDSRTEQYEDQFMLIHGAGISDVSAASALNSNSTPDFTPASPVEAVQAPDAVIWLTSRGGDALDILDDGDSTWTNCSSYEGDSGMGPSFTTAAELYVEAAVRDDSVLSGEELLAELDEAEERLETTIAVVSQAIEFVNDALGVTADQGEVTEVYARAQHDVAIQLALASDDSAIDISIDFNSDASVHEMLLSDDEFLLGPTNAYPEDSHNPGTTDRVPVTVAARSEVPQIHVAVLHDGRALSPLPSPPNDDFKMDDHRSEGVSTATTHDSPFAEIYGSEDFRVSSGASIDVHDILRHAELSPIYKQASISGFTAMSSSCGSSSTEEGRSTIDSPRYPEVDVEENAPRMSSAVFMMWMLAVVGAIVCGVALFDWKSPEHPRCDQLLVSNSSARCHEVWAAISFAESNKLTLGRAPIPATGETRIIDHAVPGLLEADVIAACELVVDMHTNGKIGAVECDLLGLLEDERANEGAEHHPRDDIDHAPPPETIRVGSYLIGLALTLLAVAFLQYDSLA